MKFTIAYYLLLLYTTVILSPLLPFVSDWWSHEFNEVEHISEVHARFGSQHLQVELGAAAQENNSGKTKSCISPENQVPVHTVTSIYKIEFMQLINNSCYPLYTSFLFADIKKLPPSPPPKRNV